MLSECSLGHRLVPTEPTVIINIIYILFSEYVYLYYHIKSWGESSGQCEKKKMTFSEFQETPNKNRIDFPKRETSTF